MAALEVSTCDHTVVSVGPLPAGWGVTTGNSLGRRIYQDPKGYALADVVIDNFGLDGAGCLAGTLSEPGKIVLAPRSVRVAFMGKTEARPKAVASRIEVRDGAEDLLFSDVSVTEGFEVVGGPDRIALLLEGGSFSASLRYLLGQGYVMASEGGDPDSGRFLTNRIFCSVVRADYRVERMRVGSMTNFEKLAVSVWTNGTVAAARVIRETAAVLAGWYSWMMEWASPTEVHGSATSVPEIRYRCVCMPRGPCGAPGYRRTRSQHPQARGGRESLRRPRAG